MKNSEQVKLIIFGVCFFIFLLILVFSLRKFIIGRFQRKCRAVGLHPSPSDSYICIGNWKDAQVAVERCSRKYCNTIYVFMDIGDLPSSASQNIGYFMQGLQTNYIAVSSFGNNRDLERVVSGSWRGLYFKSDILKLRATEFHLKQLLEAMYLIRTELRRRIFGR